MTGDHAESVAHDEQISDGDRMSRRVPVMIREVWFEQPSTGLGGLDVGDDYDLEDLDARLRELDRDPRDGRDDREHDHNQERDEHRDEHREERR